jgi:phospholipase C
VLDITVSSKAASFLEDAARGTLPSVSWIDPAFTNFNPLGFPVGDDHPPADVKDGQDLILAVYDALASSPQWERSLLVVTYDEHGGFFDHVAPPRAEDDDSETFGRYGVRVPTIIVSPWVERRSVSHTLFDHTSIIKTIVRRFCPEALNTPRKPGGRLKGLHIGGPQHLGARFSHANDLGELLSATTPRRPPSREALIRDATARPATAGPAEQSGSQLTDLQKRMGAAAQELARLGHPAGTP